MAEKPGTSEIMIPREVQKKIAEGRALQERLAAEVRGEPILAPAVQQEPPPVVVVGDPPPEPQQAALPQDPPPVIVEGEEAQPDATDSEFTRLEHAYRSLQGRYNNEVERARSVVEEQAARMVALQQQLLDLTARVTENSTAEKKVLTPSRDENILTDDEVRDYTPQFFDMMRRVIRSEIGEAVDSRVAAITPRVDKLADRISDHDASAERARWARFDAYMDANVSGWREQDADPDFSGWLKQVDAFSGVERMKILHDAIHSEQMARVKLIYEGYASERQAISPPRRASAAAAAPAAAANGRDKLSRMAAPNGGRSSRPAPPATAGNLEAVPLTEAEIAAYYSRKIRFPKSLTPAEIDLMERRIAFTANMAATSTPLSRQ